MAYIVSHWKARKRGGRVRETIYQMEHEYDTFTLPGGFKIDSIVTEKTATSTAVPFAMGTTEGEKEVNTVTVRGTAADDKYFTIGSTGITLTEDGVKQTQEGVDGVAGEYETRTLTVTGNATAAGTASLVLNGATAVEFPVEAAHEVVTFVMTGVTPIAATTEVATFSVTAGASGAGNVIVAGETIAIAAEDDTTAEVAAKIYAHSFTSWTVTDPAGGSSIVMTAKAAGVIANVTAADDTGGTPCGATFGAVTTDPAGAASYYHSGTIIFILATTNATPSAVTHVVPLTGAETTASAVGDAVRLTTKSGWTIGGTAGTITFTRTALGKTTGSPAFSKGDTGVVGSYTTSSEGAQTLATDLADTIRDYAFSDWGMTGSSATATFTADTKEVRAGTYSFTATGTGMSGSFVRDAVGEAVVVAVEEVREITVAATSDVDTTATIVLDDEEFEIVLEDVEEEESVHDTVEHVAAAIGAETFAGWVATVDGATVTFTADTAEARSGVYSFVDAYSTGEIRIDTVADMTAEDVYNAIVAACAGGKIPTAYGRAQYDVALSVAGEVVDGVTFTAVYPGAREAIAFNPCESGLAFAVTEDVAGTSPAEVVTSVNLPVTPGLTKHTCKIDALSSYENKTIHVYTRAQTGVNIFVEMSKFN